MATKKKNDKNTHDKLERDIVIRDDVRKLEQFYTTNQVDNMLEVIEQKKEEIVSDMVIFAEEHEKPCKWDKEGNPIAYKVIANPLVINQYFFKPIVSIGSIEPEYNAEKLAMVFDYYCYLVTEVNDKIGNFPSSLTSFCKLAGITSSCLKKYKNSSDMNMRIIVEKIYDQIGDTNITMSQLGMVSERSTIFKMKAQNEIVEKVQPSVHISITEKPNMDLINERISKYKNFATKKSDN